MTSPMETQMITLNPMRLFRAAILNGVEPPPHISAHLQAMGVDVGELETRIRQQIEWRH